MDQRPQRLLITTFATAVLAAMLAACGGSDGSDSGAVSERAPDRERLTIGFPSGNASWAAVWIAKHERIFAKHGLEVETSEPGALVNTQLLAGKLDLAANAPPIAVAEKGGDVAVVWGQQSDSGVSMVAKKAVASIDALRRERGCRIATFPPGTSPYAYAARFVERLDLDCDIVTGSSAPTMLSGVQAGSFTAAVLGYGAVAGAPDVNVLISNETPEAFAPYALDPYVLGVVYGVPAQLERKREAITRFVRAMREAQPIAQDPEQAEVAVRSLRGSAEWATGQSDDFLAEQVDYWRPYLWKDGEDVGYVAEQDWNAVLAAFEQFALDGYDRQDGRFAYDQMVDMSFYDAARDATR